MESTKKRGAYGVSRGSAVSGAAQALAGGSDDGRPAECGIALSDRSRISLTSLADVELLQVGDEMTARMPGQQRLAGLVFTALEARQSSDSDQGAKSVRT